MRRIKYLLIFLTITGCVLLSEETKAWNDDETHRRLTTYAANNSALVTQDRLYALMGFPGKLDQVISGRKVLYWLREGAELEDAGRWTDTVAGKGRFYNHFHDPLKEWSSAGLNDYVNRELETFPVTGKSSIEWAQNGIYQMDFPEGDWSWETLRRYYYQALVATSDAAREDLFARAFKGLGFQMHLVQDAAVPEHVRNDQHALQSLTSKGRMGEIFLESWAMKQKDTISSFASAPFFPNISFSSTGSNLAPVPVARLIDNEKYTGNTPNFDNTWGLAEYANANFFSDSSVFAENESAPFHFPYPAESSTDLAGYESQGKLPIETEEYGLTVNLPPYIEKTGDGEQFDHLVRPGYWTREIGSGGSSRTLYQRTFYQDEKCHSDYARLLIPKAVGYSAALLDYFFRGAIYITPPQNGVYALYDPKEHDNEPLNEAGFSQIKLSAMNVASDEELMNNGSIDLVVKYKVAQSDPFVTGYVPSGEFQYAVASEKDGRREIPRSSPVELTFDFPNKIPMYAMDVSFYLVYRGDLGKSDYFEKDAVAAGFTDASEPTPYDFMNNMDRVCINGGWLQAGSQQAIQAADANGNGIVDPSEWDIFPHDLTGLSIRFFPYQAPTVYPPPADFSVATLHPGESDRVFVIAEGKSDGGNTGYVSYGMSSCNATLFSPEDHCSHGYWPQTARLQIPAIKRQKEEYTDPAICSSYGLVAPCTVSWYPQFPTTFRDKQYWALRYYNFSFPSGGSYCLFDQEP